MNDFNKMTPKEIVGELDKFIIGQDEAKKSVAIALRNRYERVCCLRKSGKITPKKYPDDGTHRCG